MHFVSLALLWAIFLTGGPAQSLAQDPSASPVESRWCYRCHGPTGTADNPRIPNLAGQKSEYIVMQLKSFQLGDPLGGADNQQIPRVHRSMGFNAKRLPPIEIRQVAEFYANQKCQSPTPHSTADIPVPAIVKQCVPCHGDDGIGREGHIPNLAAQKYAYLMDQLKNFSDTVLGVTNEEMADWRQHPKMSVNAGILSQAEMDTAVKYFSMLPCK